jgi:branched-chain amino acid transport system substrate-binding protein
MKNVLVVCFVIVCLVAMFSSPMEAAERSIKILVLDAYSGPAKDVSDRLRLGCQFLAEEVNAKGGLLGRKVEFIFEDSQVKPDVAVRKAQKYLLENSVDAVVTGVGSHVNKALTDLTKQYNILMVSMTMADESTGKDFAYHNVRLTYSTSIIAKALVSTTARNKQFKKVYLLNQDYSYGRDMATAIKKEIKRQIPDAEIVGEDYHPLFIKDFSPFLTKIKASGADVILTANYGTDITILLKQRRELGVKAIVVGNALVNQTVVRENPEAALGNMGCDSFVVTTTIKEGVDFVNRWKKRFKGGEYPEPDSISARTYIGLGFLMEGIKKAQSVKVDKLVPVLEILRMKSLNGEVYMRACDHQFMNPLPAITIDSTTPPYFSAPVMLPISATITDEKDIANPRCKK